MPSLPPQNRKYSQGSKVTDIMPTSKRTDRSISPEEISQTYDMRREKDIGSIKIRLSKIMKTTIFFET